MADFHRPVPQPDDVTRPFWDACARRMLCFQQCATCGYRWLPASVLCPRCWAADTQWVQSGGSGTVFSYAVYHRAYHPAFKPLLPYAAAVVELSEGPRLVTNVVGAAPQDIRVGMPVQLEFIEVEQSVLPVFRPAERKG
ncbi:MAG: Zn-ribbon domain-containing OB-fold protein [Candidatus Binatia bacterium]